MRLRTAKLGSAFIKKVPEGLCFFFTLHFLLALAVNMVVHAIGWPSSKTITFVSAKVARSIETNLLDAPCTRPAPARRPASARPARPRLRAGAGEGVETTTRQSGLTNVSY
jgi:hypothetical protein